MTLEETYSEINLILRDNAEPLESVRLVETYRRYLKPETVRVVLLGESHVFTSDEDRGRIHDADLYQKPKDVLLGPFSTSLPLAIR